MRGVLARVLGLQTNNDGSYYYSNSDGSTYHNDGSGGETYTSSSGSGWTTK
ncbi:hypothetical protein JCM8202v2_004085 [Rhodotorula sphaerocarpa]